MRTWLRRTVVGLSLGAAVVPAPGAVFAQQPAAAAAPSAGRTLIPNPFRKKDADVTPQQQLDFARLLERRNQLDEAEQAYRNLLQRNVMPVACHHRLAVLAAQRGRFDEADQHFRAALTAAPATAEVLSDLGYLLYLQDRLPDAEKVLRDALAIEPHHEAATVNLGLVVGQLGRDDEALKLFRSVGNDSQAHCNLAFVLAQRGDFPQAQAAYSHALSLDPDNKKAALALLQVTRQLDAAQGRHPSVPDPLVPMPRRTGPQGPAEQTIAGQGPAGLVPGQPLPPGMPAPAEGPPPAGGLLPPGGPQPPTGVSPVSYAGDPAAAAAQQGGYAPSPADPRMMQPAPALPGPNTQLAPPTMSTAGQSTTPYSWSPPTAVGGPAGAATPYTWQTPNLPVPMPGSMPATPAPQGPGALPAGAYPPGAMPTPLPMAGAGPTVASPAAPSTAAPSAGGARITRVRPAGK